MAGRAWETGARYRPQTGGTVSNTPCPRSVCSSHFGVRETPWTTSGLLCWLFGFGQRQTRVQTTSNDHDEASILDSGEDTFHHQSQAHREHSNVAKSPMSHDQPPAQTSTERLRTTQQCDAKPQTYYLAAELIVSLSFCGTHHAKTSSNPSAQTAQAPSWAATMSPAALRP